MIDFNVKIIEDLKECIALIKNEKDIKNLFCTTEKDFTRDRELNFSSTVLLIVNMLKRSLSVEIQNFFENCLEKAKSCTKSAFSSRRQKIKPEFFQVWNGVLADSFYKHYDTHVKRWKGFKIIAVDGSTASLINKDVILNHFGGNKNQHGLKPLVRIMKFYDVLNQIVVFSKVSPYTIGEQTIVEQYVENLPQDSLSIYDRGFPSFTLMYLLMNTEIPRHFLMRCKVDFNKEVNEFMKSQETDAVVDFFANDKAKEKMKNFGYTLFDITSIRVRMIKIVLETGEVEVLLTNLYDLDLYPKSCFKDLYFMRWGIETSYDIDKNKLQMEQFSGQTVVSIEQDIYATMFTFNIQSIIAKQCEEKVAKVSKNRVLDYKVNKNVSIGMMKDKMIKLFLSEEPKEILMHLQNLFEKHLEPIRPNRKYKRNKDKIKPRGKFNTLTNYKRAI